jgi:hypothetical protein
MKILREPLPSTFRINQSSPFAKIVREKLDADFANGPIKLNDSEEPVAPPHPIDWFSYIIFFILFLLFYCYFILFLFL